MKINLIILGIIIALSAAWGLYSTQRPPQFSTPLPQNMTETNYTTAPDFTYTTIEEKTGRLSDHQGKVVLLHFWASWCAPCIVEFPEIIELAQSQSENLIILAVSTDDNQSDIQKFLKRLKKKIPANMVIIQDGDKSIAQDLYQTIKLPETYLITPDRKIAKKIVGPQDNWLGDEWREKIVNLGAYKNISE